MTPESCRSRRAHADAISLISLSGPLTYKQQNSGAISTFFDNYSSRVSLDESYRAGHFV